MHREMRLLAVLVLLATLEATAPAENPAAARWSPEQARAWADARPWLVGCNFLPSTAVNDVEMWQAATFDRVTIDRELGWAEGVGFNTVRVFLNFVVWEADPEGLKRRLNEFLAIADRHGMVVMPVLLDDCNFAGRVAAAGPQPAPVPGVHNSQWVSSPPLAMVTDRTAWPRVEDYMKDVVAAFARDRRVVVWDLYNEPGNSGMGQKSLPLVEAAFAWARAAGPTQPLTAGVWGGAYRSPIERRMAELSDIVSFHNYHGPKAMEAMIAELDKAYGRPLLCTEWMARDLGSTIPTNLPLLKAKRIGGYNWGLVAGRTQTFYPWGSPKGSPEPKVWHHDLFRADGTPYDAEEIALLRRLIKGS